MYKQKLSTKELGTKKAIRRILDHETRTLIKSRADLKTIFETINDLEI